MADEKPQSLGGHLYINLEIARKELRHQAHVYANTKKTNKPAYEAAGENLEKAAVAMVFAATLWGLHADCARPARTIGTVMMEKMLEPPEETRARRRTKKPR